MADLPSVGFLKLPQSWQLLENFILSHCRRGYRKHFVPANSSLHDQAQYA